MNDSLRYVATADGRAPFARLRALLECDGWRAAEAPTPADAVRLLDRMDCGALLLNEGAGEAGGAQWIEDALRKRPGLPVVVALGGPETSRVMRWTRLGARECLVDGSSEEAARVRRALLAAAAEEPIERDSRDDPFRRLAGESRPLRDVVEVLRLAAPRRSTVLIGGATGTGKELAARAVHDASPRAGRAMVMVNCGAIPGSLVESELFGYEKGAFTGAETRRLGRFEQANNGTIFLDEVGDLPLPAQVKLLRTLQEGEVQRMGGSQTVSVDVRIVAASNRDLARMVEDGDFREDLFYRLNVVPVRMPSLAERVSDIPMLVDRLLERICAAEGLARRQAAPEAVKRLRAAAWPGNVRQLENVLARAVALSGDRRVLAPSDLALEATPRSAGADAGVEPKLPPGGLDYDRAVARFEISLLKQALERANGNKKRAADLLQVKRTTFAARWKSLGGDSQVNRAAQGVASC